MSQISLKSISGITSITTPAGVDNQFTLHTNNTSQALKLDSAGNIHINNHVNTTGVTTATNFKTGSSNLHSAGVEVAGVNVLGGDTPIGLGATIYNSGAAVFTGVVTATSFSGSGANLTNLPVPTTITVADESSDTTCNPLFVTTTSGNLAPKTGTNLTFNSSSGNLRTSSLFLGTGSNESKTQDGLILERNSGDGEVHITAGRSGGNYSGLQFYVAGGSGVTKRHQMIYDGSFRWYGADGTTERIRITSAGNILINNSNGGAEAINLVGNGGGILISRAASGVPNDGQTLGDIGLNSYSSSQTCSSADVLIRGQADGNHSGTSAGSALLLFTKPSSTGPGSAPTERLRITKDGHVIPGADNAYDLGSSTNRFKDLYIGDAHFSNRDSANEVDGTWGDWTLQEGENDIFMINNRSGKKFKINLTEVS